MLEAAVVRAGELYFVVGHTIAIATACSVIVAVGYFVRDEPMKKALVTGMTLYSVIGLWSCYVFASVKFFSAMPPVIRAALNSLSVHVTRTLAVALLLFPVGAASLRSFRRRIVKAPEGKVSADNEQLAMANFDAKLSQHSIVT